MQKSSSEALRGSMLAIDGGEIEEEGEDGEGCGLE